MGVKCAYYDRAMRSLCAMRDLVSVPGGKEVGVSLE